MSFLLDFRVISRLWLLGLMVIINVMIGICIYFTACWIMAAIEVLGVTEQPVSCKFLALFNLIGFHALNKFYSFRIAYFCASAYKRYELQLSHGVVGEDLIHHFYMDNILLCPWFQSSDWKRFPVTNTSKETTKFSIYPQTLCGKPQTFL